MHAQLHAKGAGMPSCSCAGGACMPSCSCAGGAGMPSCCAPVAPSCSSSPICAGHCSILIKCANALIQFEMTTWLVKVRLPGSQLAPSPAQPSPAQPSPAQPSPAQPPTPPGGGSSPPPPRRLKGEGASGV
jgi:hypothetical protein